MLQKFFHAPPNRLVFAFNCCIFLLIGSTLNYLDRSLITINSAHGMLSFETSSQGELILRSWIEKKVLLQAYLYTAINFVFIYFYSLLLLQLLNFTIKRGKILIIGIVLLGFIENIFILISLFNRNYTEYFIQWPAILKLVLLLLVIVILLFSGLPWLSQKILELLKGVIIFRFVIISLLGTFFLLWASDQGQDLLLSLNSNWIGPVAGILLIIIIALCSWFLPKYYVDEPDKPITFHSFFFEAWDFRDPDDNIRKKKKYISRIFGAAGFIIPGVSILHAMQTFQVHYLLEFIDPFMLMIVLFIFYSILLERQWKWLCNRRVVFGLGILTAIIILLSAFLPNEPHTFLALFAMDCLLLSLLFLLYTNVRNVKSGGYKRKLLEKPITPFVVIPALVISLVYFVGNFNPLWFAFPEDYRFFTLPIVFSAIIFYLFVLSFLRLIGKKYKVHIITLLLFVMFVLVNVIPNNFHRIKHYTSTSGAIDTLPLQDLDTYADHWLAQRKNEIDSFHKYFNRPYPIFLVNAYGGGIRAAAWTGKFVHHLDTLVYNTWLRSNSPYLSTRFDFQHYVFSYSGASGGTMGAAVLCAQRYAQLTDKPVSPHTDSLFFSNDFLTPVIVPLLGRDLWLAFTGQEWVQDRARIQERTWEHHASNSHPSFRLDQKMSSYWTNPSIPGEVPLLFSNSYLLDSGLKAIVAPVKLDPSDFPASYLVNNRIGGRSTDSQELRLSTAALMSARFPFISPAGELDDFHHFMDGGLKENSGAETSTQLRIVLESALARRGWTPDSVRIIMLSVNNSLSAVDSVQIARNVFELGAPLTALMNNWVGNTIKADLVNQKDTASGKYKYFSVKPECSTDSNNLQPVLPLGWQISDASLTFMDRCLSDPHIAAVSNNIVGIITKDVQLSP
jgi:hypothetical protein